MKKLKIAFLLLSFIIYQQLNASCLLEDFNLKDHAVHYNALPSVEDNSALLNGKSQFTDFLKAAAAIVTRYELEQAIGLRLIHAHFGLAENQIMSEEFGEVANVPSLITSAQEVTKAKERGAVPSSWIFTQDPKAILLFEASNDPAVKTAHAQLQKSPAFFDDMRNLLVAHDLVNLLAVAILQRTSIVAGQDQVYLEVNDPSQKSVVQLCDANKQQTDTIRTSWSFKGPREHRCLRNWYCMPDGRGKHTRKIDHEHIE